MQRTNRYLEILLEKNVLRFGSFKTKSGRLSPYFFNMGEINSGAALLEVAALYADLINEKFGDTYATLFGPAYKGIPLCVATATVLAQQSKRDVFYSFNRKEAKDHGEGGNLVGYQLSSGDKVVITEDVLTAGTSLRESMALLEKLQVQIVGVAIGVDREERGSGTASARDEIAQKLGVPIVSLIKLSEVVAMLWNKKVLGKVWIDDAAKVQIDTYRAAN